MLYLVKAVTKIVVLFLLSAVLVSSANNAFSADNNVVRDGSVAAYRLNVRVEPSAQSKILLVLKEGARITIHGDVGTIGAWVQIQFEEQKGYVRNRSHYIQLIESIEPKTDSGKISDKEAVAEKSDQVPDEEAVAEKSDKISDEEVVAEKPAKAPVKKVSAKVPEKPVKKSVKNADSNLDKKKNIETKIKKEQEKIISFSKEERVIIEGLNEIDSTLNKAKVRVSHISTNLSKLESKIEYINEEKEKIIQEYDQKRIYAGTRLNALYRMRMLGKFEIVSEPDSFFDFILQQKALGIIIDSDMEILNEQIVTMNRYENLEEELKQKRKEKLDLERELNQQISVAETKSKRKKEILNKIKNEKKLTLAAVKALKKSAQELNKEIEQINKNKFVNTNSMSFFDYQGRLSMPVKGKIISKFGASKSSDNKSFTFQSGIDIRPKINESVRAVFYGKVIFSKWFQGYGNLMIIDHGDSYYSLYAHNKELLKKKGEIVEKGEDIAIAGDTGSIKGLCLHFEIRHHGKPVNPMKWLKKGA